MCRSVEINRLFSYRIYVLCLQASSGDKGPQTCAVKAKGLLLGNDQYLDSFSASDILSFLLNAECDKIFRVSFLTSCSRHTPLSQDETSRTLGRAMAQGGGHISLIAETRA